MSKITSGKYRLVWSLIIAVVINMIAAKVHFRLDLTTEKRYTLSDATRRMLGKLDGSVDIDILLKGDLKAGAKKLAKSTEELLEEFSRFSNGKVQFHFTDPITGLDDSARAYFYDSLQKMGIQPRTEVAQSKKGQEQTSRTIIPGAIVKYNGRGIAVDLLKGVNQADESTLYNNAEALLEYKFANAINKLSNRDEPAVGYVLGNGEPLDYTVYNLIEGLRKNYVHRFHIVRLDSAASIEPSLAAIIIVKPIERFNDAEKLRLDQYIMHGGNVIFMIDNLHAEMDSLRLDKETIAYDRGLNLEDLLFRYGVRINPDLVLDMQCATINFVVGVSGGKPQMQPLAWPYFPLLVGSNVHPVSKNLDPVFSRFTNSIDTVQAAGITKTVLLQSSVNARTVGTPAVISFESVKTANDPAIFNKPDIPVAVLLEGRFHSLYANRISTQMADTLANVYKQPFLAIADRPGKLIVCSGAEIAMNEVTQRGPAPMGYNKDINYTFANQDFIQNCFDYLVDSSGILEARAKDVTLRLLDPKKVEEDRGFWQFITIVVPIIVTILLGFLYQVLRRRRYAR